MIRAPEARHQTCYLAQRPYGPKQCGRSEGLSDGYPTSPDGNPKSGPEGRPLNFSPARKGWEIPQDDPSAGGAAPNLLSCATPLRAEAMRTVRRALGSEDPPQTMSVIDSF